MTFLVPFFSFGFPSLLPSLLLSLLPSLLACFFPCFLSSYLLYFLFFYFPFSISFHCKTISFLLPFFLPYLSCMHLSATVESFITVDVQNWNYPPRVPAMTQLVTVDKKSIIVNLTVTDESNYVGLYITSLPTKGAVIYDILFLLFIFYFLFVTFYFLLFLIIYFHSHFILYFIISYEHLIVLVSWCFLCFNFYFCDRVCDSSYKIFFIFYPKNLIERDILHKKMCKTVFYEHFVLLDIFILLDLLFVDPLLYLIS